MKTGTPNHLKTKRLKRLLGKPLYQVVGVLEMLWQLAADCADEGNIGKFSDEEIGDYMEWDGDAGVLIDALVKAGWIDADEHARLLVHDWQDHAPTYIKERVRKRRMRTAKRKQRTYGENTRDTHGTDTGHEATCPATVPSSPNPTKPNQTKPEREPTGAGTPTDLEREFMELWNKTPGVCRIRKQKLTSERKTHFRARLQDSEWFPRLREALGKFPLKCTVGVEDPWRPDADFILKPDSVTKILEGKYDWTKNGNGNGQRPQEEPRDLSTDPAMRAPAHLQGRT